MPLAIARDPFDTEGVLNVTESLGFFLADLETNPWVLVSGVRFAHGGIAPKSLVTGVCHAA